MGHPFQEGRLAGLGGRDDQAALAAPDRGEQVDDAAAHLVGLGFELQPRIRIDRDELAEGGTLPELGRRQALDRFDALHDRAGAVRRKASDQGSGLQPFPSDQVARDERVFGGREVIGG